MLGLSKIGIYTPTQCALGTLHFPGGTVIVGAAKPVLFGGGSGVADGVRGVGGGGCSKKGGARV